MPAGGLLTGGLIASAGSGIAGSIQAQQQANQALAARNSALQQWLALNVPDPAQQAVELQRYQQTGQLSPQLESAFQQQQTNLKNMQIDPTSRAAEISALTQLQNISKNGGMDALAQQQQAQAINTANANEAGQRGAIIQNFAARGIGGSGAQLAAELQAQQGDANQAAASGLSAAASAQQRALQALSSSGTLASTLNNQDYGQAAAAAQAQDAINRFNTQNSQNVSNANVEAQNKAQAANLAAQQAVSNANVGLTNQQEMYNKGLLEQQYKNAVTKASGAANAENGVANQYNTNAENTADQWAGIGKAISQGTGAIAQYENNNSDSSDNSNDNSDEESNSEGQQ